MRISQLLARLASATSVIALALLALSWTSAEVLRLQPTGLVRSVDAQAQARASSLIEDVTVAGIRTAMPGRRLGHIKRAATTTTATTTTTLLAAPATTATPPPPSTTSTTQAPPATTT